MFNRICALIVALTMIATTGAMANIRDSDAGAQRLVICSGMGPQVILIGGDGEQVDPAPICPDCTMVLDASTPRPFVVPYAASFRRIVRAGAVDVSLGDAVLVQNQPRAPPVLNV